MLLARLMLVICLPILAFCGSAAANTRTVTVPAPSEGNVTVAHVKLGLAKKGSPAKKAAAVLVNAGAVPDGTLVLGGARKSKGRAMAGTVVLAAPVTGDGTARAAAAGVKVEFRLGHKRARFAGEPKLILGVNLAGAGTKPGYCGKAPRAFGHMTRLLGSRFGGFTVAQITAFSYKLGCGDFPQRSAFLSALTGSEEPTTRDPNPDGGGDTGGGEEDSDGDGVPDDMDSSTDINGNGIDDSVEEEENGGLAPVAGGGSGSLSLVDGQPNQVRYTMTLEHDTNNFTIRFPRTPGGGDASVAAPDKFFCTTGAPEGEQTELFCTTRDPSLGRTRTPSPVIAAGTQLTGIVALNTAPTAGMGAKASYYVGDLTYAFDLTGP